MENLLEANTFAKTYYATKKNINGKLIIDHCDQLVDALKQVSSDETVLIAAMLSHILDDNDCTPEKIESRFGPAILAIVNQLTVDKTLTKRQVMENKLDNATNPDILHDTLLILLMTEYLHLSGIDCPITKNKNDFCYAYYAFVYFNKCNLDNIALKRLFVDQFSRLKIDIDITNGALNNILEEYYDSQ